MQTNVPHRILDVNRALLETSSKTTKAVASTVADGVTRAVITLRDAGATVVGQARSAVERTATAATTGVKQVVGQARAQGERAGARVDRIADRTARRATSVVDGSPSAGTPYEQWTKAELYERAQELDVDGRSSMSKRELIAALRSA